MAAVISSGAVCHSRVEPSTSASSKVTVPVGSSSLTPKSLQFGGSISLMLASFEHPPARKHQYLVVDCARYTTPACVIYVLLPMVCTPGHGILEVAHRLEEERCRRSSSPLVRSMAMSRRC